MWRETANALVAPEPDTPDGGVSQSDISATLVCHERLMAKKQVMTEITDNSVAASYRTLQPLFYGALARLAAQGFAVPPADALDLIHDFFLEAWPGITARYDPAQGRKEPYVYRAFIRFARPRIIRLQRLQSGPIDEFEKVPGILSDRE